MILERTRFLSDQENDSGLPSMFNSKVVENNFFFFTMLPETFELMDRGQELGNVHIREGMTLKFIFILLKLVTGFK